MYDDSRRVVKIEYILYLLLLSSNEFILTKILYS